MSEVRILITEDEMGIARALTRALSLPNGGGYRVDTCDSGEAATRHLRGTPYELLITDLRLPGLDGLELIKWARQNYPQTRSILITAYGSPQIEEQARHLANAYLPKPFRLNDLIRLVKRVLEEATHPELTISPVAVPVVPPEPASRKGFTHLTVLATDLDGTLAENGEVSAETWEALHCAKAAGLSIILVTGRPLETFTPDGPYADVCEAIVAENGAIVYFPRRDSIAFPFGRLTPEVLQHIDALEIPMERGLAIISTHIPHDQAILEVLRKVGGGATVEYNRGSVMVLPLGATKGTGLQYALYELGYSSHNVLACGDAENDRSLFEVAEFAAAVDNAPPSIKALADTCLSLPNGKGIQALINDLLTGSLPPYRSRPYRQLSIGRTSDDQVVHIDPFTLINGNLGIFGASSSGKSWLAGLLAEELLKQGYQVCIIDPEGEYRSLASAPHTLLIGGSTTPLPSILDLVNFIENGSISLILDLSLTPPAEHAYYCLELLRALQSLRARRGRPHWFLIDEAQNFCPSGGGLLGEVLMDALHQGGVGLISYRPSQIDPACLQRLHQWLFTRLKLPEEIEALKPNLSRLEGGANMLSLLPVLPIGQAYLCQNNIHQWLPPLAATTKFQVGSRTVPHIRHLHKYLRAPLPAPKRFYFHDSSGKYLGRAAANLWEFREALGEIPLTSIEYHLARGDYQHWLQDVLRDAELARQVHKITLCNLQGEALRQGLIEAVANRYEELESLA